MKDSRKESAPPFFCPITLFSALFQDFAKFERSVGSNVVYGAGRDFNSLSDEADVIESIKMVGLEFLADELPEGLETILGRRFEGGQRLSIGQWQRLATARALYKKPKLLVLDEPTASVDAVSERAMFKALDKINDGLTILLVAHRFTTISHADYVIVLDGGRVVGSGTHDSLLSTCKFYADLYRSQYDYR
ncbi:MAG: ABC transporter ATP-binding protein [Actinomycetaceae bacterium]|nr:ABC transporter ATP-binding protein [Actinomycetaceae bacterium]